MSDMLMGEKHYDGWLNPVDAHKTGRYEARLRPETFGCWDVFHIDSEGRETMYMRQIIGRAAKQLASDRNKMVDRLARKAAQR